jgi:hypothetical protein
MRIEDHLDKKQKQRLKKIKDKCKPLSQKQWEDIMGVHKDTYKRVKGSWRRK